MSTFLELCNDVAEESGTMGGRSINTTLNQAGRASQVVGWVNEAWHDIQTMHDNWRWMQADFSGALTVGKRAYTPADMGISDRFGGWMRKHNELEQNRFTVFKDSQGQADEGFLAYADWDSFRRLYLYGSNLTDQGYPQVVTIDPQENLQFHAIPDDSYTARGSYWKAPQTLAADGDLPEMPVQFHKVIKWKALEKLALFDEDTDTARTYGFRMSEPMFALERSQRPRLRNAAVPLDEQ